MRRDYSKQIFEKFYDSGTRRIRITLKNGDVYLGRFVGFYRGAGGKNDPYIFRWHFLPDNDIIFDYDRTINPDLGIIIEQEDIADVAFA